MAVVVDIRDYDSEALAPRLGDARRLGDVGECAVAVVVEQKVGNRWVQTRMAIVPPPLDGIAAEVVFLYRVVEIPHDEEVEQSVSIEVGERGRRRPTGTGHSRLLRHVGESPIAVVVV